MKASDYIVDFFINQGITDVFGIPGGIVLDLLESFDKRKSKIKAHLNYHEQSSAFAACGYSQISGKPGLAYATKGPGVTNLITGITNAYFDSIATIFISAHSGIPIDGVRFVEKQEFDTIRMVSGITKYAERVINPMDVRFSLEYAYYMATTGRPGPVFLDFSGAVLKADIDPEVQKAFVCSECNMSIEISDIIDKIKGALKISKRPVLLIGDGIRQSKTKKALLEFVEKIKIPVVSSRFSQDILAESGYYYGFVGSHATRASHFILSKCDLVISFGNRISYNKTSKSFENFTQKPRIINIEIDKNEFSFQIPNIENIYADLGILLPILALNSWEALLDNNWILTCIKIKDTLINYDNEFPVKLLANSIKQLENNMVITSDVGKNEIWLSHAYAISGVNNRILYSKSFGVSGCSLPKAIGAYYACKTRVICFTGDVGIQMNLQELQYIAHENIPVTIILLNNFSSGLIRDEQKIKFNANFIHSTISSGYSVPDFSAISKAFLIPYVCITDNYEVSDLKTFFCSEGPMFIEIKVDEKVDIHPSLPKGRPYQDFDPKLDTGLYKYLDNL
ncbi:acetolactate synthase [Spirochaetia bacterium]|nr:acetolactate synthase [Spirochaetia bacterium]